MRASMYYNLIEQTVTLHATRVNGSQPQLSNLSEDFVDRAQINSGCFTEIISRMIFT